MASTTTARGRRTARSLRGLLADSAYAYLGLGSATVELVRSIDRIRVQTPQRARTIGKQAPERLRDLVQEGVSSTLGLPGQAAREFDDLARRGRELVGAIRTSSATRAAVDRTRVARSRVKAASTSIGKAAEGAVQATERAATIVATRTEPSQQRDIEVQPPKVQAAKARVRTSRTATGRQATTRRSAAAKSRRSAAAREDLGQRTAEEPREQARESGVEGRASMTKDELANALTSSPPRGRGQGRAYEERTVEELQERAKELGIEDRASMTKDELIKALRQRRS
jgi:hypothetical protein